MVVVEEEGQEAMLVESNKPLPQARKSKELRHSVVGKTVARGSSHHKHDHLR